MGVWCVGAGTLCVADNTLDPAGPVNGFAFGWLL